MSIRHKNKSVKTILDNIILPHVAKPGRYVGNEINLVFKKVDKGVLRFAIAFPEVYEIAMSSQAVHILYHILNRLAYVWAERVFAPWNDMEERMRQQQLPLFTLESFTPLLEMDIIGFSLQYELTYTNVLNMLNLARIPLKSRERNTQHPLIIAGGPCTGNPEPLSDFIDVFYIGDAEAGLSDLCALIYKAKKEKMARKHLLHQLAQQPGVYVPALYQVNNNNTGEIKKIDPAGTGIPDYITTRIVSKLSQKNYPIKPIVPLIEITHDRLAVEVMRGCTAGCRFCSAGMIYRPVRERPISDLLTYADQALTNSGFDEISFLSLSISDYSQLLELMQRQKASLAQKSVNTSFPSMRLDSFSEDIAQCAADVRKSGFTFAPEAGSERLRAVVNKNISDEDLFRSIDIALRNGWKILKFYFMIGLPTETQEDIHAIVTTIERIIRQSKQYGRIKFTVSISPFSPKPHTPFQWESQETKEALREKTDLLRNLLKRYKQVKLSWRDPAVAELETILGRGDRRLNHIIFNAWQKGARFDGWSDYFRADIWQAAFEETHLEPDMFTRELSADFCLPWQHIDKGVSLTFLRDEREKAYAAAPTENCQTGRCTVCGIQRFSRCNNSKLKEIIPVKTSETNRQNHSTGASVTYRLRYRKNEYARYISHLDTIRIFDRACRRAKLPILFSQGYNPRPKMSFAPPLALGYTSDAEYVDIAFYADPRGDIGQMLNDFLPAGMKVLEVKRIREGLPSLSAGISTTEFIVDLGEDGLPESSIQHLLKQSAIEVERQVKGVNRRINVRPYIDSIKKRNNRLLIRTKSINGRTCRIQEILHQLLSDNGNKIKTYAVHRKEQFINNRTPMQLDQ
jgi:radical SAM family uncharacterized protein/radical SAM-linked protein